MGRVPRWLRLAVARGMNKGNCSFSSRSARRPQADVRLSFAPDPFHVLSRLSQAERCSRCLAPVTTSASPSHAATLRCMVERI
jgi:hypothetical protein